MSYRGLKRRKSDTHARTHTHTHTSGRQLKIEFLDVSDYSEYSDTNISNFFFSRNSFLITEEAKLAENDVFEELESLLYAPGIAD